MRTLVKLSVGLNIGFLGLALLLLYSGRIALKPANGGAVAVRPTVHPETESAALPAETPAHVVHEPFQWSQLESADYRTYVANLREIGCPGQTIRDIISADLDAGYYKGRRQQLERELFGDPAWQRNPADARTAAIELCQLQSEEASIVATLMGTDGAPGKRSSLMASVQNRLARLPARLPLAFHGVNTDAMKLSPQELDFIESVQQTFRGDIGDPQDPTDPAYLHRWQVAQRNADYSLRDMLGQGRYDEYEEQANEQSAAQP